MEPDWLLPGYEVVAVANVSAREVIAGIDPDYIDAFPSCAGRESCNLVASPGDYKISVLNAENGAVVYVYVTVGQGDEWVLSVLDEPVFSVRSSSFATTEPGLVGYQAFVPEETVPRPPPATARGSMLPWLIGLGAAGGLALLVAAGRGRHRGRR